MMGLCTATSLIANSQTITVDLDNVSTSAFKETFDLDDASWATGAFSQLVYANNGTNGFVSHTIAAPSMDTTLFRGYSSFDSSGSRFVGDWISDGITSISFDVIHDWPAPVTFFSRIAPPANFPGQIAVSFVPVLPNTWTTVTLDVSDTSVQLFGEGQPFANTFSDVGNIQIGISALVPEPNLAAMAMMGLMYLGFGLRQRADERRATP